MDLLNYSEFLHFILIQAMIADAYRQAIINAGVISTEKLNL